MNYEQKYLKYKKKYLDLKQDIFTQGGSIKKKYLDLKQDIFTQGGSIKNKYLDLKQDIFTQGGSIKNKYLDLKGQIGGEFKQMLVVCSSENRKKVKVEDPEMDDLPELLDIKTREIHEKDITDFVKYKFFIFAIINNLNKTEQKNIKYSSVDPVYSNIPEDPSIEDINYLGHQTINLIDLSEELKYDYIIITSCYPNFFKENILKIKKILNPGGYIFVLKGVGYKDFDVIINEHCKLINKYEWKIDKKHIHVYQLK